MSTIDVHSPLVYIECDVPEGVTLRDWRASRAMPRGSRIGTVLRGLRRTDAQRHAAVAAAAAQA
ncbi:MAG TPA: hypothetical protein VNT03_05335 [Baekduia sp.]|nr:hypothetical protein [Baekduia sp.]